MMLHGRLSEKLDYFKYLGGMPVTSNYDYIQVKSKLIKFRRTCTSIARVLIRYE